MTSCWIKATYKVDSECILHKEITICQPQLKSLSPYFYNHAPWSWISGLMLVALCPGYIFREKFPSLWDPCGMITSVFTLGHCLRREPLELHYQNLCAFKKASGGLRCSAIHSFVRNGFTCHISFFYAHWAELNITWISFREDLLVLLQFTVVFWHQNNQNQCNKCCEML